MSQTEPSAKALYAADALLIMLGLTDQYGKSKPNDIYHTAIRFDTFAAQSVAAHARGPEIYVTEGGTLVIAENGDEFEVGSDGSMSGGNLEDYKYIRLLPEITKQLSPEQLRLFPLAAHAREPDEAMVEAAAKALCADDGRVWEDGHFGTIRDSYRWKARIALAAIGSVPQDRNAILDEVFAAISPTTVRNERIIRALKSPEKSPAPSDDNSHSHIIDQARYWLSRIDTRDPDLHRLLLERNMVVTSLIGERAKPAASDLEMIGIVTLVLKGNWPLAEVVVRKLRSTIDALIDEARREAAIAGHQHGTCSYCTQMIEAAVAEAAADMRERAVRIAVKVQMKNPGSIPQSVASEIVQRLRALPLTEEETIPKAEGTSK